MPVWPMTARWARAILMGQEPPLRLPPDLRDVTLAIMSDQDGYPTSHLPAPAQSPSAARTELGGVPTVR